MLLFLHYDNVLSVDLLVPLHELFYYRRDLQHLVSFLEHPLEHHHHVDRLLLILHLLSVLLHVGFTKCVMPFNVKSLRESGGNRRVYGLRGGEFSG